MADYSSLTKKELLYTLLARDLMLEERRKENDLQKATINTLIVDHKASKEWYKKQLEEKDEFLKKQKELFETVDRELYLTKDTLKHHTNIYNSLVESRYQDKISFAVEKLEKVKAVIKARLDVIEENYSEDFYDRKEYIDMSVENDNILKAIDNQIKQLKEGK